MSAAELIERYSDPAFRDALTPLMDLRLLLTECKVPPTYQVRRDMYDALSLTPAGDSFRQLLTKKNVKCPFTGGLDLRAHGPLTGVADLIKPAW
jgi:hypothetical protein